MKTSTILIGAGLVLGGLVLYKSMQPQAATTSPWVTLGSSLGGAVSSVVGLFKSTPATSGYTLNAPDQQDQTIVPTPVASSSTATINLATSSFSRSSASLDRAS